LELAKAASKREHCVFRAALLRAQLVALLLGL
jgi:hypothetical protein